MFFISSFQFRFLLGLAASLFSVFCRAEVASRPTSSPAALSEAARFWKKKELSEALFKERKILVSVTHQGEQWHFRGAGLTEVSAEVAFSQVKNFERLKALPEHFPLVEFSEKDSVLHLIVRFMGKEHDMHLHLTEVKTETESRLYFRHQTGWLEGTEGLVMVEKGNARQNSIVSLMAEKKGSLPWIPNWLFTIAAEAVMHHVSLSLRKGLEKENNN